MSPSSRRPRKRRRLPRGGARRRTRTTRSSAARGRPAAKKTPARRGVAKKAPARRRRSAADRRARRREWRTRGIILGSFAAIVLITLGSIALVPKAPQLPDIATVAVNPSAVPPLNVAGYDREQLVNAAVIVDVGNQLGLGPRDQAIAVMTRAKKPHWKTLTSCPPASAPVARA